MTTTNTAITDPAIIAQNLQAYAGEYRVKAAEALADADAILAQCWTNVADKLDALALVAVPAARVIEEPTALLVERFRKAVAHKGLDFFITWTWDTASKYRNGVIVVHVPDPNFRVVAQQEFVRNTHLWTPADARIGTLRRGSPKTRAVESLLATLSA